MTSSMGLLSRDNNPLATQKPRRAIKLWEIPATNWGTIGAGGANRSVGNAVDLVTSRLIGKTIVGARFKIRRVGNPTGLVYGKIYGSAGQLLVTMGSVLASSLNTVTNWFDCWGFSYSVPVATTRVVAEYTGGDASNLVEIAFSGLDWFDGASTLLTWFDGVGWNTSGTQDCGGNLWVL